MVADSQRSDALAQFDHLAGGFMAEDQRRRQRDGAVGGGRSEWQTPQAAILTVTSPRSGPSTPIVSTTTGLFSSRQMTALFLRCIALSRIDVECAAVYRLSAPAGRAFRISRSPGA